MKTQSIGRSRGSLRAHSSRFNRPSHASEALQQYKIGRENGAPLDSPNRAFPSAGLEALNITRSTYKPEGPNGEAYWPDAQQRYWWTLTLEGGGTNEDFYWTQDTVRGYPDKSDSERYWFTIHGPNGVKMEGFSLEADRQKGFPDIQKQYWRYAQYTECGPIKEWMQEKDRNYLARLESEKAPVAQSPSCSYSSSPSAPDGFSFFAPFKLNASKEVEIPEGLIPKDFLCPITQKIMLTPVMAMDDHTYEHEGILRALGSSMLSPMTGKALPNTMVIPNLCTRSSIRAFLDKHPECWTKVYVSDEVTNELLALSSGAVPLDLAKWIDILRTDPRLLTLPLKSVSLLEFLSSQSESIVKTYLPAFLNLLTPKDWQDLIRIRSAQDWLKLVAQTCERCAAPELATQFFSALQIGLEINIKPLDMAVYALEQKHIGLFKLAIRQLQNVNETVDDKENTLLHLAARQGKTEMVQCLVKLGADLSQRNVDGLKAKGLASKEGFQTTADQIALLKMGPVLGRLGLFTQPESSGSKKRKSETQYALSPC